MLIAINEMKRYAHSYTWSEASCSMLCKECSYMLIAIHGVMLYAHYYTWSEALCLMRYKD